VRIQGVIASRLCPPVGLVSLVGETRTVGTRVVWPSECEKAMLYGKTLTIVCTIEVTCLLQSSALSEDKATIGVHVMLKSVAVLHIWIIISTAGMFMLSCAWCCVCAVSGLTAFHTDRCRRCPGCVRLSLALRVCVC